MEIIYLLLIVSLCIALLFLASFIWAAKTNQFEDDYTPSVRILFEDEHLNKESQNDNNGSEDRNSEV